MYPTVLLFLTAFLDRFFYASIFFKEKLDFRVYDGINSSFSVFSKVLMHWLVFNNAPDQTTTFDNATIWAVALFAASVSGLVGLFTWLEHRQKQFISNLRQQLQ